MGIPFFQQTKAVFEDDDETTSTTTPPGTGAASLEGDGGFLPNPQQWALDVAQILAGASSDKPDPDDEREPWVGITGEGKFDYGRPVYGPNVKPPAREWSVHGDNLVAPQYTAVDPRRILNDMSAPELEALEREMVRGSYLDEDDMVQGASRSDIIGAFTSLVTRADVNRVSWQQQLEGDVNAYQQWLKENPEEEETPKTWRELNPFVAPVFVKPDYASLAQGVKETVRTGLQRDPTSNEMRLLSSFMNDAVYDQWKSNEYDVALANWENQARAHEDPDNYVPVMDGGTVQGVDAAARFAERYEEKFAGELEHRERNAFAQENAPALFGSIDTISRMMT